MDRVVFGRSRSPFADEVAGHVAAVVCLGLSRQYRVAWRRFCRYDVSGQPCGGSGFHGHADLGGRQYDPYGVWAGWS